MAEELSPEQEEEAEEPERAEDLKEDEEDTHELPDFSEKTIEITLGKKKSARADTGDLPKPIDFDNLQFGREYEIK
jgi:hypothetical protein